MTHDLGPATARPCRPYDALSDVAPGSDRVPSASRIAVWLIAGLAATAFSVSYVGREQPIYYWDWGAYFNAYHRYGALFVEGGIGWLRMLADTIRSDDYNMAILTPMLPAYAVFGGSRTAYIVTIVVAYVIPTAWMSARLSALTLAIEKTCIPIWLFGTSFLFWPFWIAALRGMPDVAGLIPLGLATLLVFETRYLTRASIRTGAILGLLVWMPFLLRRWYAYASVSLEVMIIAFAACTILRHRRRHPHDLKTALQAFLVNILVIVACLSILQKNLVVRILDTSYAALYIAYQQPIATTATLFYAQSGLLFLIACAMGLTRAAVERNDKVAFTSLLAGLTAILFLRTQAPGVQHVLPVFFWLFPAFVFGATWPFAARLKLQAVRALALPMLMLAGFLTTFSPRVHAALGDTDGVLPSEPYLPLRLSNRASYDRLTGDLKAMMRGSGDKVAIFASSPDLSDTLLASLEGDLLPSIIGINNVDARDGLDLAPFKADFAVVTLTPALHLQPQGQRIVAIPNGMIRDGTGPGAGYHEVAGPYTLDGGIVAFIYRRGRPFSDADTDFLLRSFQKLYPAWTLKDGTIGP